MKRSWVAGMATGAAICAAFLTFDRAGRAQNAGTAGGGRIAYVKAIPAMNAYQRLKDLRDEIAEAEKRLNAENERRTAAIKQIEEQLRTIADNDPVKPGRMRDLLQMKVEYKAWAELSQLDMTREFGVWQVTIYKEFRQACEDIARSEGYDAVLYYADFEPISMDPDVISEQVRSHQLIYGNPGLDITQKVLDRLNQTYAAQPRTKMLSILNQP